VSELRGLDLDALTRDLERDEGCVLKPYKDTRGFWTIGYGHKMTENGGIQAEIAKLILEFDRDKHLEEMYRRMPWIADLDPVRQRVLGNMAFNLGVIGLMQFHETLEAVRSGKYELAAKRMLSSLWADQVGARARRLAQMMKTGIA